MKLNALKVTLIACAAALCLSAATAPTNCKEIAMSKCTKESSSCEAKGDCDDQGCAPSCSSGACQGDQSDASMQVKTVRKSAAQKVVEGN